jgi:ubiquinone/menaquinone biosynthesis C-methylase UbiE
MLVWHSFQCLELYQLVLEGGELEGAFVAFTVEPAGDSLMNHPIFARLYARVSPAMDRGGLIEHRRRLLAGLAGRVIEVGAGNGLNFAHYPPAVTSVLAVEPEPVLRELARQAAENAAVPVEVVDGVAKRLPIEDASVDAAVACLVLCSVPDQVAALRELRRVLRPGGELRFLEHVRAETPGLRRVQRLLDATFWPMLGGGCHAGRDTVAAIENAGFTVERADRLTFPESRIPLPASPHVLGTALNPGVS